MAEKYANHYIAHIQNDLTVGETDIFVDIVPPATLQVALDQPGDVITDTWMAKIGDELLRVIDYDINARKFTVERAQEGSVAAEHSAGAVIGHVVTAGSLENTIDAIVDTSIASHLADTVDAHDASAISFVPGGTIAATDVQAAILELASEDASAHIADATDAHDASAISVDSTNLSGVATDVQASLEELDNMDWPIISWGQDGAVVVADGVHKFPVPYDMTITRIEATLDVNGPAATVDFSIALQDMYVNTGAWTLRNAVTTDPEVIISANDLDGSIIAFADASIPAGDVLRLDIKGADVLAESPVVTVWARRT